MKDQKYQITPPTKDPAEVYPSVPGINYNDFKLTPERMSDEQRARALEQLHEYETTQKANMIGYQVNLDLDFQELNQYLNFHINNIGDPFVSGNFTQNSKFAERAVLDYFASLWNARWPHENSPSDECAGDDWKESYWGYVVSMGGTEANLFGLWNARDYLAGRVLLEDPEADTRARNASRQGEARAAGPHTFYYQAEAPAEKPAAYSPIAFYSQDTHYSIIKAMRILNITTYNEAGSGIYPCPLSFPEDYPENYSEYYIDENGWPYDVPSNDDGSIHIPSLVKLVRFFAEKGHPILINFNYGSTFKGAYDDVEAAVNELVPILKENGLYEREVVYDPETGKSDTRTGYWFHVDGALGAAYMSYLDMFKGENIPNYDFRIPEVHSIAMSGHKWLGAPWPCGIYMSKVKYQLLPPDNPNYIGSPDSTFAGSRNGFSALTLWYYISQNSFEDFKQKIADNLDVCEYTYNQLKLLEAELGKDLWVEYTPKTLTLRFKEVNERIVFKYSLSGEELYVDEEQRSYNHIYIMNHVTKELIDQFIEDLRAEDAFPEQSTTPEAEPQAFMPSGKRGTYVPFKGRGFK